MSRSAQIPSIAQKQSAKLVEAKDSHIASINTSNIILALSVIAIALLWFVSHEKLESNNKIMAALIGILTLSPWYFWFRKPQKVIPFYPMICTYYFMIFCPAVFLDEVEYVGATQYSMIRGDDLFGVLMVVVVGLISFSVGNLLSSKAFSPTHITFDLDPRRVIKFCLIYLLFSSLGPIILPVVFTGGALARFLNIVYTVNGSVSVYLLTIFMMRGLLSNSERFIFFSGAGLLIIINLASGWLTGPIYPIMAYFLATLQVKRSLEVSFIVKVILVGICIIIFNGAKQEFREQHWQGKMGGASYIKNVSTAFDRAFDWLTIGFSKQRNIADDAKKTVLSRVSNLDLFGHIVLTTPDRHRFTGIQQYASVPAMFVPRRLWPDKPTTMDVTNDIVLRYGYIYESQIGHVAMEVGIMPEAYISNGMMGVVIVMIVFGFFVGFITAKLGDLRAGLGWNLIVMGIMCGGGMMVAWTASSFCSSLAQAAFVMLVLYYPLRVKGGRPSTT